MTTNNQGEAADEATEGLLVAAQNVRGYSRRQGPNWVVHDNEMLALRDAVDALMRSRSGAGADAREALLREARDRLVDYVNGFNHAVKAADFEAFPYRPAVEDLIARIDAALTGVAEARWRGTTVLETAINHERDPHCCGCYSVGRDLIATCNECGHTIDLKAALDAAMSKEKGNG
jgi:hypothetical protein